MRKKYENRVNPVFKSQRTILMRKSFGKVIELASFQREFV